MARTSSRSCELVADPIPDDTTNTRHSHQRAWQLPILLGAGLPRYQKVQQNCRLPEDLEGYDIFGGTELRLRTFDGKGGHVATVGHAASLHKSFTCILRVRPDFSSENEMPLIFCATPPYDRNTLFHLTLRDRRPYFGFGWNNLGADDIMPENVWTWLVFVYDSTAGRRILVDGKVASADSCCEPFSGYGGIEIGHWFAGSFKGELANLVILQGALTDRQIRSVLGSWGLSVSCMAWASGCRKYSMLRMRAMTHAMEYAMGAKRVRRFSKGFNRFFQLVDVLSDLIVAIDNATSWKRLLYIIPLDEECEPVWAYVNFTFIVVPFVAEYMLMFRTGVATLSRLAVACPVVLYSIFGLPTMVVLKAWLLVVHPFADTGHTPLTFLGAFDTIDLIVQATFETPWQAAFSAYMFQQRIRRIGHKGSKVKVPITICISFMSSLMSLLNCYCIINARQKAENVARHDLRTGWAELDSDELGFLGTASLVLKAGMGSTFSSKPGEALDEALDEVLWALRPPSTLETLILENNDIEDCSRFAEALRINQTIVHLDLSENNIQDWQPLASALTVNTTLHFFCVKSNHIRELSPFADMLEANSVLQSLVMGWNDIEDLSHLAQALCRNRSLQRLNLCGNKISDVAPLIEMLTVNTSLKHLNLSTNQIQRVSCLTRALKVNTTLELLCLGGNPIKDEHELGPFGHVEF